MGSFQDNQDEIITGINITPLVDIMLVLLIIFMMVSSIVDVHGITVELPQAATGDDVQAKTVSVMISPSGDYYLAGERQDSFEALTANLDARKRSEPDIQVAISADRKTCHGDVIRVIDMVRTLDIARFAINVEYLENAQRP
ncbi:biopolymer transporter ExbD [Desulfatiferula olefinivorans]